MCCIPIFPQKILLYLFRKAATLSPCQPCTAIGVAVFNSVTPTHHKRHYHREDEGSSPTCCCGSLYHSQQRH